jgi:hypothetical protein
LKFDEYHLIDELTKIQKATLVKSADKAASQAISQAAQAEARAEARLRKVEEQHRVEMEQMAVKLKLERDAAREDARRHFLRGVTHQEEAMKAELARKAAELAKEMVIAHNEVAEPHHTITQVTSSPPAAAAKSTPDATSTSDAAFTPSLMSLDGSSFVAASTPVIETVVVRAPSLLRRVLTGIASPFTARNTTSAASPPKSPSVSESPSSLGQLPSSRKRPAPEAEQPQYESPHVPTTPTPMPRAAPSSLRVPATMPTTLSTISERTEPSETDDVTQRATSYATPSRTRSINKVRAARQSLGKPSSRISSSSSKIVPREPNADVRQTKLKQQQRQLAEESNKENRDSTASNSPVPAPRATKRVKIYHLKAIPHNRPGDSEGTFRFPDLDSDDEMEVDIDAALRSNIFEESESNIAEQQAQVAKEQARIAKEKAQLEQQKQQEQLARDRAQLAREREQLLIDKAQFAKEQALASASPRVDSVRDEQEHASLRQSTNSTALSNKDTSFVPSASSATASGGVVHQLKVDLDEKLERRLAAANLRQQNWQVRQWLRECEPCHVDKLQKELEEVVQAQDDFAARELTLPTPQRISEYVEGEFIVEFKLHEWPEGGKYDPAPNYTTEQAAGMLTAFDAAFEHWRQTGEARLPF